MDRIQGWVICPPGLGLLVAVGGLAARPVGGGPSESRRVVWWGLGKGDVWKERVMSGWAPSLEQLFLAEAFVLVHMWWRSVPQRSALKYWKARPHKFLGKLSLGACVRGGWEQAFPALHELWTRCQMLVPGSRWEPRGCQLHLQTGTHHLKRHRVSSQPLPASRPSG